MEGETYDLIISNPPFYDENFTSTEENRNLARFTEALPFEDLVKYSAQLLAEQGKFCTIIPHKNEEELIQLASKEKLFPQKITRVRGHKNSTIKRSLLQFGFEQTTLETSAGSPFSPIIFIVPPKEMLGIKINNNIIFFIFYNKTLNKI